jgi:hypothetical protein
MMQKKVAIVGVPRSGTSWLGQIFNSHPDVAFRFQPLFSYGHKGRLSEHSSADEIRAFFEEILTSKDAFALMKSDVQKNYPAFVKAAIASHIAFKETRYLHVIENILMQCRDVTILGIVRNPLAVLASWISAPKEYDPAWDLAKEWRGAPGKNQNRPEEFYGFDKWKEVAAMFLRFEVQYPKQFALVRYDELNRSPRAVTRRLFDWCGLDIHAQVEEFLCLSRSRHDADPYSVFRAQASDDKWHDILPGDIVEQILREVQGTLLSIFLGSEAPA